MSIYDKHLNERHSVTLVNLETQRNLFSAAASPRAPPGELKTLSQTSYSRLGRGTPISNPRRHLRHLGSTLTPLAPQTSTPLSSRPRRLKTILNPTLARPSNSWNSHEILERVPVNASHWWSNFWWCNLYVTLRN